MFINVLEILLVIILIDNTKTVERLQVNNRPTNRAQTNKYGPLNKKETTMKDYLRKFEPRVIWENIDKQRKYLGRVISDDEQSEIMLEEMDAYDEVMALKVENGDPKMIAMQDPRRGAQHRQGWTPGPGLLMFEPDRFRLRQRFFELMKQAIYMTRTKMVVMQHFREKYKNRSLYKMGFLTNRAENAAKLFGKFSFRAFRACILRREYIPYQMTLFDLMSANERQLHLWFNLDLLVDLLRHNNNICMEIFKNFTEHRKERFDKLFED